MLRTRTKQQYKQPRQAYYLFLELSKEDDAWLTHEAAVLDSARGRVVEQALRAERYRVLKILRGVT